MNGVQRFVRASGADGALAAKRADPNAAYLAGGTLLLAGDRGDKPSSVIDLGAALPRGVDRRGGTLVMGAGTTFQELAESRDAPAFLVEAALTMVNRNTRNRATLGGNLGADKSCSSLLPILIALSSEIEVVSPDAPSPTRLGLEDWLRERAGEVSMARAVGPGASDLVVRILVPLREGRRAAYRRWNRVSCDLSVLGAAAAFELAGGAMRGFRLALGGLGPRARRFPLLEALFEGSPLPSRERIESMVAPLLSPIDDLRASAAFKRLRGAQLIADAMRDAAEANPDSPKDRP
jgi:CO/xanthine dehydrogenase FAD-binding subunit